MSSLGVKFDVQWHRVRLPTAIRARNAQALCGAGHPHRDPGDYYFCVWDGFADANVNVDDDAEYIDDEITGASLEPPGVQPGLAPQPAGSPSMPHVPKVVVPNRAHWLFRGPLAEVCRWDTARGWPGQYRLDKAKSAIVWPVDWRPWMTAANRSFEPLRQLGPLTRRTTRANIQPNGCRTADR